MQKKIDHLKIIFSNDKSERQIYEEIIKFGHNTSVFPEEEKIKKNLINGCQSLLYLTHRFENGKIEFNIHSEALISKGLANILLYVYSGEDPKHLFSLPPTFLNEMKIIEKISMTRQIGIGNLFNTMRLFASKYV